MPAPPAAYRGRFAPSPSGPLHAGSLVAALASWLDARANRGVWLVRIEDVDAARCTEAAAALILAQLADCGLFSDEPPLYQSSRAARYQTALDRLIARGRAYPCGCSRREIGQANAAPGQGSQRHRELVYPGTCREGLHGRPARAWRFRVDARVGPSGFLEEKVPFPPADTSLSAMKNIASEVHWTDRRLGPQLQDVAREVGDFVLRRADGLWAYQLAVVVDDAEQRISDVVRGEDLADNTARQILLQRALGVPTPRHLHTPLVRAGDGAKLSKQNGAAALDTSDPLAALDAAAGVLGLLPQRQASVADALLAWSRQWRERFALPGG